MAETLAMAAMGDPGLAVMPAMPMDEDLPLEEEPILTDEQVLRAVRSYKEEARAARETRMRRNETNWLAYYGESDYSSKLPGQSRQVVPKVSESVEALAAFVKRSLTDYQSWFSVKVPTASPIPETVVQKAIQVVLDQQQQLDEARLNFPTLMSDAMKVGSLGSLMIFKVSHYPYLKRRFVAERGMEVVQLPGMPPQPQPRDQLVPIEQPMSAVVIDLIPPEDYYPDPSGRGLYVIHTVERDLEEVQTMADQGAYDPEVVAQIQADFQEQEFQSFRAWSRNQDQSSPPSFRKKVVLDECWATFLDETGRAILRNAVATIANDHYVIRKPVPNPYWHQHSPFVAAPLIRIPFSEWHKAVQDNAVALNNAQNELLNLIIDGGYEAVWGVRQLHLDWLEDPTQVQDGIAPGDTLLLRQEVPANAKVLERVTTGGVPQDALAVYNILDREYNAAAMVNDVKMGMLPEKAVKACVPLHSQALTREGWRSPHELRLGDEILGYSIEKGMCVWTPLEDLYLFDEAEVYEYRHRSITVQCTEDHKWVQRPNWDRYSKQPKGYTLLPFGEGPKGSEFLQAAPAPDGEGLGRIGHLPWHLMDRERMPAWVLQMTSAERQAFIIGVLAGEGTRSQKPGSRMTYGQVSMTQNAGPVLDAFRLACALEGIATNAYIPGANMRGRSYTYRSYRVALLHSPWRHTGHMIKRSLGCMPVWCPSVPVKTWVMRQGDTITITGNTEIVVSEQHQASTFDGIVKDIEDTLIEPLLWKIWLTVLQFLDDFSASEVIAAIGERWAYVLSIMSPAQRYATFAGVCQFQASGLSATLARGKDLQNLLAFVDVGMRSPFLAQTFIENYSAKKYLDRILQTMNLDPESLELSPEEKVKQMQQAATLQMQGQQAQPGGGPEPPGEGIPGVGPGTPQGGRTIQGSPMPPEGRGAPGAGPGPAGPPGGQPSVPMQPQPPAGPMPPVQRG